MERKKPTKKETYEGGWKNETYKGGWKETYEDK
jgi:hypothetical protein